MPIKSILQSDEGVWIVHYAETASLADFRGAIDSTFAVVASCRAVWDLTGVATLALDPYELRAVAQAVADSASGTPRGRLAVVAPADHLFGVARQLEAYADSGQTALPVGVFREPAAAKAWLAE